MLLSLSFSVAMETKIIFSNIYNCQNIKILTNIIREYHSELSLSNEIKTLEYLPPVQAVIPRTPLYHHHYLFHRHYQYHFTNVVTIVQYSLSVPSPIHHYYHCHYCHYLHHCYQRLRVTRKKSRESVLFKMDVIKTRLVTNAIVCK